MITRIVILGAGGHARDVLDVIEACNGVSPRYEVVGFVVDTHYATPDRLVNGAPILGDFTWLARHAEDVELVAAVGSSDLRLRLAESARARGGRFAAPIVHPSAVRTPRLEMGEGCVVGAGVTMTSLIRMGRHVHINNGCTVAHDVRIGDYATIAPGAHLSGNVTVGEGASVGSGAIVIEKLEIGAWSVVGAGSVVIRNVAPDATVVGNPARLIKQRPPGWQRGVEGAPPVSLEG
jgi:sugar O-acyltransferase (sialic acid O-acetyltransferase NeuD family)